MASGVCLDVDTGRHGLVVVCFDVDSGSIGVHHLPRTPVNEPLIAEQNHKNQVFHCWSNEMNDHCGCIAGLMENPELKE
jgi:hypothetical protein